MERNQGREYRLYLLGQPRFEADPGGLALQISSAKTSALLAYLALSSKPVSRESLIALLWPESLQEAGRKNLRNTLWAVRKNLGELVVDVPGQADHLTLAPQIWVDARHLEKLATENKTASFEAERLLELYQGPLLDGVVLPDAPDFESWLTIQRERFVQLYLRKLTTVIEGWRGQNNWAEVIKYARLGLAQDNLQEPLHRYLIEAYARQGERSEALRQYETLRTILERELGLEPLPETEKLRQAILTQTLQPVGLASALPIVEAGLNEKEKNPQNSSLFVGRESELNLLGRVFEQVKSGQSRVALLTGEAGLGKTRLWREWLAQLPPSVIVLEGRGLETTQNLPFVPLIELFNTPVCRQRLFSPAAPVAPLWLSEMTRLIPDLAVARPDLPSPAALPPEEERRRVFEAFVQCLAGLTSPQQPLVVFLDDVHWADRTTLEWLGYLVRRLRNYPLLVVLAYRLEETPATLQQLVAGWGREGIVERINLTRLSPAQAARLFISLGGAPGRAAQLQTKSAGNPYFLLELSRTETADSLPPALTDLIKARLARLPALSRQVAQAAAILEPDFDVTNLRRTAGRSEEETLDGLDGLLAGNVLSEETSRPIYNFVHPLVAEVLRSELSGARQAFLHRRAAQARELDYSAGGVPTLAGRIAFHYWQAGEGETAATWAERAAEHALTLAAFGEAVEFYRRALEWGDPVQKAARHFKLGHDLYRQGELANARTAYLTALSLFEAKTQKLEAAQVCLNLADTYLSTGSFDQVIEWAERGLGYLAQLKITPGNAEAFTFGEFLLGAGYLHAGKSLSTAEAHLLQAFRLAGEYKLSVLLTRIGFEMGNLRAHQNDLKAALASLEASIQQAVAVGDPLQQILSLNNAAYYALELGNLELARQYVERGLQLSEEQKLQVPLQWLYSTRGELALALGEWNSAEEWFKRGLSEAEVNGNLVQAANYQANLGLTARGRGQLDEAVRLLKMSRQATTSLPAAALQNSIDLWLVETYQAQGRLEQAASLLGEIQARLGERGQSSRQMDWAKRLAKQLKQAE